MADTWLPMDHRDAKGVINTTGVHCGCLHVLVSEPNPITTGRFVCDKHKWGRGWFVSKNQCRRCPATRETKLNCNCWGF